MNTPTSSVWRNKPAINTRLTILAISLACAVSALPLDVRAQAQATSINLPVQPLSKSLLQLGQQASVVLDELPDICRQVYIYQRLEGSSHAEIASELGISRAMVEKHMNKALRHLSTRLQKYAP